jgi:hypothetical protein
MRTHSEQQVTGRWRKELLFPLAFVVAAASGCVKRFDAYLVNPCPVPLAVETHASPVASSRVVVSVELEPKSVTLIENAFHSTGADSWSVTIEGSEEIVKVDGDTWVHDTVVIPAEVCNEIESSG